MTRLGRPLLRRSQIAICLWANLVSVGLARATPDAGLGDAIRDIPLPTAGGDAGPSYSGEEIPADRPATVPTSFVLTPFGWFHPSCVLSARTDEVIRADKGYVESPDGKTRYFSSCQFDRFTVSGDRIAATGGSPPSTSGYQALGWTNSVGPVTEVQSQWLVPNYPAVGNAQLYLFSGLEPPSYDRILQPVLGYNQLGALTTNTWTVTSWDCCVNGTTWYATPFILVNPGQLIKGKIAGTGCNAQGLCSSWQVVTSPQPFGICEQSGVICYSQTLSLTGNTESMTYLIGGAFEIGAGKPITSCAQLPASLNTSIVSIEAQGINGAQLSPTWTLQSQSGENPNCWPGVGASNGTVSSVNLTWWPSDYGPPSSPTQCGALYPNQGIEVGNYAFSCDLRFGLTMQTDGNMVLYETTTNPWTQLWSSNTAHKGVGYTADYFVMQTDGNFVIYAPTAAVWATNTNYFPNAYLAIQNDGNVVIYWEGEAVWSTGTWGH